MQSNTVPGYQNGHARNITQAQFPQLWKGLIGMWAPTAGRQGMRLDDFSNHRKFGTLENMTSVSAWNGQGCRGGFTLDYDGTDDDVVIPSNIYTNIGSLSVWFRSDTLIGISDFIIFSGNEDVAGSNNYLFLAVTDDAGRMQVAFGFSGFDSKQSEAGVAGIGKWTHVVLISDGTVWSMYGDGKKLTLTFTSGAEEGIWFSDVPSINQYCIGALTRGAERITPFNGLIGDVLLYNRVLDPSEIRLLASGASPLDYNMNRAT